MRADQRSSTSSPTVVSRESQYQLALEQVERNRHYLTELEAKLRQAGFEGDQLARALQPAQSYGQLLAEHVAELKATLKQD